MRSTWVRNEATGSLRVAQDPGDLLCGRGVVTDGEAHVVGRQRIGDVDDDLAGQVAGRLQRGHGIAVAGGQDDDLGVCRALPRGSMLWRAGAWALGLAALQWIPFVELLAHSSRSLVVAPSVAIDFSEPYLKTGLCLLAGKNSKVQSATDLDSPTTTVPILNCLTKPEQYQQGARVVTIILSLYERCRPALRKASVSP